MKRPFLYAAFSFLAAVSTAVRAQDYQVGDAVEGHSYAWGGPTNWGKARIIAVDNSGSHIGPYQVEFDGNHAQEWLAAADVRTGAAPPPVQPPVGPVNPPVAGGAFQVGDAVEAHSYAWGGPTNWGAARIIAVDNSGAYSGPYQVEFTGGARQWMAAADVRAIAAGGGFKIGDRVDDYQPSVAGVRDSFMFQRGVVIAANGSQYTVRYDGCSGAPVVRDVAALRPAAAIAANAPDIAWLAGDWQMFMPGAANTVTRGDREYTEYGLGAKAPPLSIHADGSYVWKSSFDAPPARGTWLADAAIDRSTMGTETAPGVIITDAEGFPWKVYRAESADGGDHITVQRMCEGVTMTGTRGR